jgi:PhoH-like ATPase
MEKTYILDTNVLLTDANALFSFAEHNLVLPLVVLEELDRHKDRQDEVGRNARETVRKITELMKGKEQQLRTGIRIGEGMGVIKVLSENDVESGQEFPVELEKGTGDNRIAKFIVGYKKKFNVDAILVTRDLNLQIKCSVLGIHFENYKKFNVATDSNSLFTGVVTITEEDVNVEDIYKNTEYELAPELVEKYNIQPNEFIVFKNNGKSAIAKFKELGKPISLVTKQSAGKFFPRNKEQEFAMDLLFDDSIKLVTLVGRAGCGKTLCAIAAGLEQVVGTKKKYKNLLVCRPVQPVGKEIGHLPGTLEEKMEPWIAPIKDNLRFLITEGKKGKYNEDILNDYFDNGIIEIEAMTFIRGRSIANAFMVIDEAQNLSAHELKTILTRVGEGTKIVLTGDIEQIDSLYVDSVSNGLSIAVERFKNQPIAGHITLVKGERSNLATIASSII